MLSLHVEGREKGTAYNEKPCPGQQGPYKLAEALLGCSFRRASVCQTLTPLNNSLVDQGYYVQVDDRMKFILSAAAGALGVLVTFVFIPEITSLDLKEGDTRWEMIKKGVVISRRPWSTLSA